MSRFLVILLCTGIFFESSASTGQNLKESRSAESSTREAEKTRFEQQMAHNFELERRFKREAAKPKVQPNLPKAKWLTQFAFHFASGFCADSKLYEKCYGKQRQNCYNDVQTALPYCAQNLRLPASIAVGQRSVDLGVQVGKCLGSEIHRLNRGQASRMPACQDPYQWL